MKVEYVINGTVRMIIIPENEIDRATIKEISKGEIYVEVIDTQDKTHILDKPIHEGLILKQKVKEV